MQCRLSSTPPSRCSIIHAQNDDARCMIFVYPPAILFFFSWPQDVPSTGKRLRLWVLFKYHAAHVALQEQLLQPPLGGFLKKQNQENEKEARSWTLYSFCTHCVWAGNSPMTSDLLFHFYFPCWFTEREANLLLLLLLLLWISQVRW